MLSLIYENKTTQTETLKICLNKKYNFSNVDLKSFFLTYKALKNFSKILEKTNKPIKSYFKIVYP